MKQARSHQKAPSETPKYCTLTPKKVSDSAVTPQKVDARFMHQYSYFIAHFLMAW